MPKYVELSANINLDMTAMLGQQVKKTLDLSIKPSAEVKKMLEEQEQSEE